MPDSKEESTELIENHPDSQQPTTEQYISAVQTQFEEVLSLLQVSGFENQTKTTTINRDKK